jgi:hypothetical protein
MAGHEASLPRSAVDTVIPMTRGVDKLRTVCGRLRGSAARERLCKNSDSRRFPRWEAPAATRPTVVAPAQGPADPIPGNVDRRCFGIPTAACASIQAEGWRWINLRPGPPACWEWWDCQRRGELLMFQAAVALSVAFPGAQLNRSSSALLGPMSMSGNASAGKKQTSRLDRLMWPRSRRCWGSMLARGRVGVDTGMARAAGAGSG